MKWKKIAILLWALFLLPSLIFFSISLVQNNFNFIKADNISSYIKTTFSYMVETMPPKIDKFTLEIFLCNLLVMFCIFLVSIAVYIFFYKRGKTKYTPKQIMFLAIFFNLFFYIKEGIRMGYTVYSFADYFTLPYLLSFATLILPHLIFEFSAFIMASVISLKWLYNKVSLNKKVLDHNLILTSIIILSVATIVETTLTPLVFTSYLKSLI